MRIFLGSTVSHDFAMAKKPIGAQDSHSHESSERRNAHRQSLNSQLTVEPIAGGFQFLRQTVLIGLVLC